MWVNNRGNYVLKLQKGSLKQIYYLCAGIVLLEPEHRPAHVPDPELDAVPRVAVRRNVPGGEFRLPPAAAARPQHAGEGTGRRGLRPDNPARGQYAGLREGPWKHSLGLLVGMMNQNKEPLYKVTK